MSSAITNAGEALLAQHQNQETGLVIDRMILAFVNGIDPMSPVDRTEGLPDAGDIVHEYSIPVENKGYVNPNLVVYSMLLGSDIGDFDFNWIGLYSSTEDAVIAIAYTPTLSKWKTAHPTMGNALTRNFMLEYSGIQDVTNITVEASTWQIDFTTRLKGIDERERLSNLDIYGAACFFGDAYLVVNDGGTINVQPGTAYVEGVRIDLDAAQTIAPALPAEVFLDVALQPQGSDRVTVAAIVYADPGDYQDGTNDNHYGQKIAEIAEDGTVTDFRPVGASSELGEWLLAQVPEAEEVPLATTAVPGLVELLTDTEALAGTDPARAATATNIKAVLGARGLWKDAVYVPAPMDWDNLLEPGVYRPHAASGNLNAPPSGANTWYIVLVLRAASTSLIQIAWPMTATNIPRIHVRKFVGSWMPWETLYTDYNGIVSPVGTRTTTGTWALTGLAIGKPVIIEYGGGTQPECALRVTSGADGGVTTNGSFYLSSNGEWNRKTSWSTSLIPNATTVTLDVISITADSTLRAYQ